MEYPYLALIPLLKFQCTPAEYQRITAGRSYKEHPTTPEDVEYQRALPTYVYARCPICDVVCAEPIDTYNLPHQFLEFTLVNGLILPRDYPAAYKAPCSHYVGAHTFINLHNRLPIGIRDFNIRYGEVPYITPWFVPDDVESYVVLHALPVCRIEDDEFIPSYTFFMLTYFSIQPRLLIDRHYAEEAKRWEKDPEYYPGTVMPADLAPNPFNDAMLAALQRDGLIPAIPEETPTYDKHLLYDLTQWASRGKLGWLDFTQGDLLLRIGLNLELPEIYTNIQGRKYSFAWDRGHLRPFHGSVLTLK